MFIPPSYVVYEFGCKRTILEIKEILYYYFSSDHEGRKDILNFIKETYPDTIMEDLSEY